MVQPHSASDAMSSVGSACGGDAERGRTFPCESCGADLEFNVGAQSLKCAHCGHTKTLDFDFAAEVFEQDYHEMLTRIAELRDEGRLDEQGLREVACDSCGATVCFAGTLTSADCAYCGVPLQDANVHEADHRVPVDGVLPFKVERDQAQANLRAWVSSRWFAPNDFKTRGVRGRFSGVYLPYWTFDSATLTHYTGQRGEHYWVTTGTGKNRRRTRRTRWHPASGTFRWFFDDVLVVAGMGLPEKRIVDLEPWPLTECVSFNPQLLAGFFARTYDVPLEAGFVKGKMRMDDALRAEVRSRIGGDEQRIHSINTRYDAITFKHLLLPVWMLGYRYRDRAYQVVVNAGTGEVQGDRPYSWLKIALVTLVGAAITGGVLYAVLSHY